MKYLILWILSFLTITSSYAQWGVKGGIDMSSLNNASTANQTGFHMGGAYDIKISKRHLYFQPALLFATNGFNIKSDDVSKKSTVRMYALEIPWILSFRPKAGNDMKFILDYGLYTRYGLFGRKKYDYTDGTSVEGASFGAYRRFDMGLNLGIGTSWKNISLTGTYQLGLTDAEEDILTVKHRKFRLSLGYVF